MPDQPSESPVEPKADEAPAKQETKAERKAREKAERDAARAESPVEPKADEAPAKQGARRVWAHGSLSINGKTYAAGEVVDLPEHVATTIPCLELVEAPQE